MADATDRIVLDRVEDERQGDKLNYLEYVAAVANYVGQLERFGEMMQAIEGRKHLVMFSIGYADRVLIGASLEVQSLQAEMRASGSIDGAGIANPDTDPESLTGSSDVRASMKDAVQEFLEADVVIHAIDPRGLRTERRVGNGPNRRRTRSAIFESSARATPRPAAQPNCSCACPYRGICGQAMHASGSA